MSHALPLRRGACRFSTQSVSASLSNLTYYLTFLKIHEGSESATATYDIVELSLSAGLQDNNVGVDKVRLLSRITFGVIHTPTR